MGRSLPSSHKKCSQRIHILKHLKPCLSKNEMAVLYNSLINSLISYASPCFPNPPSRLKLALSRIANRCHRIICSQYCSCNIIISPDFARQTSCSKLFITAAENSSHPLHSLIPHRLPSSGKFCQPFAATNRRKNSFIPFCTEMVNYL